MGAQKYTVTEDTDSASKAYKFFKSPRPISKPVSFSQDRTQLASHPAPFHLPARGKHRVHCSSFGFPPSSLGSPPLITQQRLLANGPLSEAYQSTPHYRQTNNLFLTSLLSCRTKLHLEGKTVSGFVSRKERRSQGRKLGTQSG